MPAEIYKYVNENKSRIFVGYQRCKIFDLISVKPCYNCARYGHSGATCKSTAMCIKCSMPHIASLCSETENSACVNCKYSNGKYETSYDINLEATDSKLCDILKSKVKNYIDTHNYLIKPTIPRNLGKVGNYVQKDMLSKQVCLTIQTINSLNEEITNSQNIEQFRSPLTTNENTEQFTSRSLLRKRNLRIRYNQV